MVSMAPDLALMVKDVLREIRFAARRRARQLDRQQANLQAVLLGTNPPPDDDRPGRIYEFSRALARPVGRMAQRLCETTDVASMEDDYLLPIGDTLTALAVNESDPKFAASFYRCGNRCLQKLGVRNVYMSEQSILRAARPAAQRHAEKLAAIARRQPAATAGVGDSADEEDKILIIADVTQAVIAAQPIKRVERNDSPGSALSLALADLNAHCFLTAGIATAVVSVPGVGEDASQADVMESAELVAAARYERFAAALGKVDPAVALARELAVVIPFLP